jgi:hypothetical protein
LTETVKAHTRHAMPAAPKPAEKPKKEATQSRSSDEEQDVYRPIPFVEEVLVTIFVVEIALIAWRFRGDLAVDVAAMSSALSWDGVVAALGSRGDNARFDPETQLFSLRAFGMPFLVLLGVSVVAMGIFVELSKLIMGNIGWVISRVTVAIGMVKKPEKGSCPMDNSVVSKKFREQGWQLAVHAASAILEIYLVHQESPDGSMVGVLSHKLAWYPNPVPGKGPAELHYVAQQPTQGMVLFYAAQLAVWIYTGFVCEFVDERRKDFLVMMSHHVITIALIGFSATQNYLRIGLMVMWVHDISDLFVDALKLANYLELDGLRGLFLVEISFVSLCASWLYWRLWLYPSVVLHASIVGGVTTVNEQFGHDPIRGRDWLLWSDSTVYDRLFENGIPLWFMLNSLLTMLLLLHVWWFILIVSLGFRMVKEGNRSASKASYEGNNERHFHEKKNGTDKTPVKDKDE